MKYSFVFSVAVLLCVADCLKASPAVREYYYPMAYMKDDDAPKASKDDASVKQSTSSAKYNDMTSLDIGMDVPNFDETTSDEDDKKVETKPSKNDRKTAKETKSVTKKPCCEKDHDDEKVDDKEHKDDDSAEENSDSKFDFGKDLNIKEEFGFPLEEETNNTVYNLKDLISSDECSDKCSEYSELVWECTFLPELSSSDLKSLNISSASGPVLLSIDDRLNTFMKQCQCNKDSHAAYGKCFTCVSEATNKTFPFSSAIEKKCKTSGPSKEFGQIYDDLMTKAVGGNLTTEEANSLPKSVANVGFVAAAIALASAFVF